MIGPMIAHETVKKFPSCGAILDSDALRQLVPARSNVAYDVMVFVGQSMYQRHKTTEEIRTELAIRNVHLCVQSGVDRVLPGFRKIIKLPALPEHFAKLAADANACRAA